MKQALKQGGDNALVSRQRRGYLGWAYLHR